jgi:2'-5' RNA ligase
MRLFAAVVPPPDVLAELAAELAAALAAHDLDGLRVVPEYQRHLTVAFYGDVREASVADLGERLRRAAARTPPLSLQLNGFGTFPANAARARVLWAGLVGDVAELTRLAERAAAAGRRAGADVDDRRYRPHLTIARARHDAVDLRDILANSTLDGTTWATTELVLVKSTLGPTVIHEPLDHFPFEGPPHMTCDGPSSGC